MAPSSFISCTATPPEPPRVTGTGGTPAVVVIAGSVRVGMRRVAWPTWPSVIIGQLTTGGVTSMRIVIVRVAETFPEVSTAR